MADLSERARALATANDADVIVCDVSALLDLDVGTIDALARLALAVRRLGRRLRLHRPGARLQELVELTGLGEVLGATPATPTTADDGCMTGPTTGGAAAPMASPGATGEVLGRRALNRATLARQLLLRRDHRSAHEVVEHLVGLQAQNPRPPYLGLWARLARFRPEALSRLLLDRRVVRVALMRGTVHLVTADDCLTVRPLVQPVFDRDLATNTIHARHLRGLDLAAVVAAGRALLDEQPLTPQQLGRRLAERWPDSDPAALAHALRGRAPLVQIPPRGVWGASGRTTYATAETWLGRPLDPGPSLDDLVLRYLAAFGPAAVADVQAWSGLTRLAAVVERLRPRLCSFRDQRGRELFDLPDAPRPDPDTGAPVRFIPEFDNLLVSHADRTRVIRDEDRPRLAANGAAGLGTVLVDGFVRATWRVTARRGAATLTITPFRRLPKRAGSSVTTEGARLLRFLAPDDDHDVRCEPQP